MLLGLHGKLFRDICVSIDTYLLQVKLLATKSPIPLDIYNIVLEPSSGVAT